jgi:hypothetical protein
MKRQHKRRTSLFTTPNQQIDSSLKRASTALAAAFAASSSPPPPWQGIGYPPTAQHLLPASAKSPRRGKIFHSPLCHSATAHSTHQTGQKGTQHYLKSTIGEDDLRGDVRCHVPPPGQLLLFHDMLHLDFPRIIAFTPESPSFRVKTNDLHKISVTRHPLRAAASHPVVNLEALHHPRVE